MTGKWLVLVVVLLVFATASCRNSSKDPIGELLAELEEAAEARDVNPFEKRLGSGFTGSSEVNRDEALTLLRRYFGAYQTIHVDVSNVERSESGNRVTLHVSFSGKVHEGFNLQNLLPSSAEYDFELRLVQEESILKVEKAFWTQTSNF